MALFDPRWAIYHDYGGSPENTDDVVNPYHTLVFPDGGVRYRHGKEDPYSKSAPHAYGLNPNSVGLSYAGPVGGQPTPQGMRALQGEYEKIQARFPGMPGMGHGEAFQKHLAGHPFARPSKEGRELQEASWRNRVTDLSQVPETGAPKLSLLGDTSATPSPAAPQKQPTAPPPTGPRPMPMFDAMSDEQQQPQGLGGYLQGLASNPLFMGGLTTLLKGDPTGGMHAANQGSLTKLKLDEHARQLAQKRKTAQIWNSAFPGGTPSAEHPLTKGLDPSFSAAIYAMGPEQGLPVLGQLQMHGADARMKNELALKMLKDKRDMVEGMFGAGGGQPQQAQPDPADALFQQPRSILPPAAAGPAGSGQQAGPGQMMPMPGPAGAPAAMPGAPQPQMPQQAMPQGRPGGQPLVMGKYTIDQARRIAMSLDAMGMRNEPFEKAIAAAEADTKIPDTVKVDAHGKEQAFRNITAALDRYKELVKKSGFVTAPGKAKDAVINERNNILLQLKEMHKLGQIQGADMEIMQGLMPPDPTVGVTGWGPGGLIPGISNAGNVFGAMGIGDSLEDRTSAGVDKLKEQLRQIRNNAVGNIGLPPEAAAAKTEAPPPVTKTITVRGQKKTYENRGGKWFEASP